MASTNAVPHEYSVEELSRFDFTSTTHIPRAHPKDICLYHCQRHRYWEVVLITPMRSALVLAALFGLILLFRRCPATTFGVISGLLITLGVWMLLLVEVGMISFAPVYE